MTVMLDVPDWPELVAVMVADPAATPLTMPLELTLAALALLVDHDTIWPAITFPWASLTLA